MWIALIVCSTLSVAVAMLLGFHLLDQRDRRRTELIRDLLDSGEPELIAAAVRLAVQAGGGGFGDFAIMRLRLDVEIAALQISLAHLQASLPLVDGKLRASLRAVDSPRRKLP